MTHIEAAGTRTATPIPTRRSSPFTRSEPAGTPWCDCGGHHPLDQAMLERLAREMLGDDLPATLTHAQVIDLAAYAWKYIEVCDFFLGRVRDAATDVNGRPEAEYPTPTGLMIVGHFSDHWSGCPDEGCGGGYVPGWAEGEG